MGLNGPGSYNSRENPDILIAEMKQKIMRGGGQKRAEKTNGPSKAMSATHCHCAISRSFAAAFSVEVFAGGLYILFKLEIG
ncbi:hypothetical protein ABKV19_019812 [Rosa sericea]